MAPRLSGLHMHVHLHMVIKKGRSQGKSAASDVMETGPWPCYVFSTDFPSIHVHPSGCTVV